VTTTEKATFDRLAAPYDRGMAPLERLWLRQLRAQLLPIARGKVLEIGVGTGANLPFYPSSITLTAIDESPDMLDVAARRVAYLNRRIGLLQADAEHLAFPANHFDTAVCSLVLCSVVDQHRTLKELRRVLRKPRGRLLLLEHMRPQIRPWNWLADLLNTPWYAYNGRCRLNRQTQAVVAQIGFEVERVEAKLGGLLRLIVARAS
jgi:ubiquinone/menaquinone biosynthesis C-methylase UbiE